MSKPQTNFERNKRKEYIKKLIAKGDKRSFTQLDADIELRNWTERYHPTPLAQKKSNA